MYKKCNNKIWEKNFGSEEKTPSISFCKNNGLRMRGVKVSHFYKIKFRFILKLTKIQLINLKIIQIIQRKRTQNKTQKYHK